MRVKVLLLLLRFSDDGDVHDRTTSDHVVLGLCHWLKNKMRLWRHSKPLQSPQSHIRGRMVRFWTIFGPDVFWNSCMNLLSQQVLDGQLFLTIFLTIRILIFLVRKIRQIEVRSALLS